MRKNLSWVGREEEKTWKKLGKGKNMIKIYLKLKIVLNNKKYNKKDLSNKFTHHSGGEARGIKV